MKLTTRVLTANKRKSVAFRTMW